MKAKFKESKKRFIAHVNAGRYNNIDDWNIIKEIETEYDYLEFRTDPATGEIRIIQFFRNGAGYEIYAPVD